jgi:hypothetical protein
MALWHMKVGPNSNSRRKCLPPISTVVFLEFNALSEGGKQGNFLNDFDQKPAGVLCMGGLGSGVGDTHHAG